MCLCTEMVPGLSDRYLESGLISGKRPGNLDRKWFSGSKSSSILARKVLGEPTGWWTYISHVLMYTHAVKNILKSCDDDTRRCFGDGTAGILTSWHLGVIRQYAVTNTWTRQISSVFVHRVGILCILLDGSQDWYRVGLSGLPTLPG